MDDPVQLALLDTYAKTIPAAFQSIRDLMVLLVLKAARAPLQHGNGPATPFFYAQYGLVHVMLTRDHETGYRFGRLGVDMSAALHAPEFAVPVHFIFAGFLSHWRRPLSESLGHFQTVLRIGQEVTVDFRTLDYMNASTVSPILSLLKTLDKKGIETLVLFSNADWQVTHLRCLRTVTRVLTHITVEGRAREAVERIS